MAFFRFFGGQRAAAAELSAAATALPASGGGRTPETSPTEFAAHSALPPVARRLPTPHRRKWWHALGPGLVTGAADNDPSGIATYSQVGAQFGYAMGWTMLFSYPLMAAIQEVSARIGCVTHRGIAANIRRYYAPWVVGGMIGLLLVANVINLGADIGAMGAAVTLLVGGSAQAHAVAAGLLCMMLMMCLSYPRYVALLKWLTLSLLAYAALAVMVKVPWSTALVGTLVPSFTLDPDHLTALVAVLGTTISPYLFFWQSSLEVEERRRAGAKPLREAKAEADRELRRIRLDTLVGMGFSNLIGLFIIVATAATLHTHGTTAIATSAQAAEALRPVAGDFAFAVFAAGIIGTGMLAVPVLAGSTAYAMAEALGWRGGLAQRPTEAKAFYGAIAAATVIGVGMSFAGIDPVSALYWSAVINGLLAPPLMAVIMLVACNPEVMGGFALPRSLRLGGWTATMVMAIAAAGMIASWLS